MKITHKEVKNFAKVSKDKNKIHLNKEFSKQFFFKEPIVHGSYLSLRALSIFLAKKRKKVFINNIKINFKNFLLINENFKVKILKNKILVYNDFHTKLEIYLEYSEDHTNKNLEKLEKLKKCNFKNLKNHSIANELIYISYIIGTLKPGNGSLIFNLQIKFKEDYKKNTTIKFQKKINNISNISYQKHNYKVQVIASKILPFKNKAKKLKLSKKSIKKINGKKILVFGASGDIGSRINPGYFKRHGCKIFNHSFRINFNKPKLNFYEIKRLALKLNNVKPHYLFYLSSPKIFYDEKKNYKLLNCYTLVYCTYFKIILDIIYKNKLITKIFYPSTIFLNHKKKYKHFRSYLTSKEKAEKLCGQHKTKKLIKIFRIPKLKTRSNYNLLGFYEGECLSVLDKYINRFFS